MVMNPVCEHEPAPVPWLGSYPGADGGIKGHITHAYTRTEQALHYLQLPSKHQFTWSCQFIHYVSSQ